MTIYSVGVSGLSAAQMGLLTTSHNISNASTPGYNRQEIVQGTNVPLLTGAGFVGQGTNVQTVRRIYDDFLGRQVLSAETSVAQMDTYFSQIQQIDNLLADPSAGLSPVLSEFFRGVQDVAASPASIPSRQSLLSAAQALVARFQSLDQRMTEVRDGINSQIRGKVAEINTFASQVAAINDRIIRAQAGSLTQVPNDLLDQRDQMLKDLNRLIKVTTITQADGSFNVFFGNGQPLVIGSQAFALAATAAADDPERIEVSLTGIGGAILSVPESQITGGALGGLVAFRSEALDGAQNSLGRIALTLAQNFNDQHKLGMDLTGALGTAFFSVSSPSIKASADNSDIPANTGQPTVTRDGPTIAQLSSSDYRLTSNGGGNFTLVRLSDQSVLVNAAPLPAAPAIDGLSFDVSTWFAAAGAPGDSFLIQPTRTGARDLSLAFSDARLVAAAAPVRAGASLANTGTATITQGTVDSPPPTNADLQQPVTITFTSATTFNVTGIGVSLPAFGQAYVSGANISFNGWTTQISGTPATNDVFTINPNANGVSDNRNAQLLGALQSARTMLYAGSAATATYQSAYSQIVSAVGSKTNEVEVIGRAQQGLADQATASVQQMSGVNLDEEAANLLRYQQAYQASAKILATASKVFDEIIALGR